MTNSSQVRAILDADVLYRAAIRDILLQLAKGDVFEAMWTTKIHEEWMAALKSNRPDISESRIEGLRERMDAETRDPYVKGYESLIEGLYLPEDPNDRHVLAAAIVSRCPIIVTMNIGHFPDARLRPFGITAQHPDTFLLELLAQNAQAFCDAIRLVRKRLQKPPFSVDAYLQNLNKLGLVQTVAALRRHAQLLQ